MPTDTIPALSIIFSGEDVSVTFLDASTAFVRVRAMPVRHLARVLQLADKEAELLDYVCFLPDGASFNPVPSGWADNLTDDSHAKLYEAAKRLNFTRAATWATRQIAAKKFTGEMAMQAEEVLLPLMRQLAGSIALFSAPSAPATPSTRSSTGSPSAS